MAKSVNGPKNALLLGLHCWGRGGGRGEGGEVTGSHDFPTEEKNYYEKRELGGMSMIKC